MLLVPKLKMPKGCSDCPLNYDGWCNAITFVNDENYRLPDEYAYTKHERYPGCPIMEVDDSTIEWVVDMLDLFCAMKHMYERFKQQEAKRQRVND